MQVIANRIATSYNLTNGHKPILAAPKKSVRSRLTSWFFTPILAPLLQRPWIIRTLTVIGLVQGLLVAMGLGGWQCPLYSTLGVRCPGCGLTTAMVMLLKGDWQLAVRAHVFAPLFLALGFGMLIAGSLPLAYTQKIAGRVAVLERYTGISAIVLLSMLLYWVLRFSINL